MHGVVSRNDSVCGASVLRAEFRQDLFALFLLSFFLPMNSNALILCRALLTRHDSVLIFLLAFSLFIGTYESYLSRNYVLLLVWQTVCLCFLRDCCSRNDLIYPLLFSLSVFLERATTKKDNWFTPTVTHINRSNSPSSSASLLYTDLRFLFFLLLASHISHRWSFIQEN